MINFEEELKKFHPSLEIDEAEDVIINHNMTDFTDILVDMVKEQEKEKRTAYEAMRSEQQFETEEDFQKLKAEGKIIEDRGYETVYGLWRYFTADNMDLEEKNYLGIGTLESYEKLKAYYGEEKIRPIYIEVEDGERLKRAIAREETQEAPKYEEMCRRFLADAQDFSEEKIRQAGISHRFSNMDGAGGYSEIEKYLRSVL